MITLNGPFFHYQNLFTEAISMFSMVNAIHLKNLCGKSSKIELTKVLQIADSFQKTTEKCLLVKLKNSNPKYWNKTIKLINLPGYFTIFLIFLLDFQLFLWFFPDFFAILLTTSQFHLMFKIIFKPKNTKTFENRRSEYFQLLLWFFPDPLCHVILFFEIFRIFFTTFLIFPSRFPTFFYDFPRIFSPL